ncbi:hypothetical protein ACFL6C_02850 [Myxococcota bacterium]
MPWPPDPPDPGVPLAQSHRIGAEAFEVGERCVAVLVDDYLINIESVGDRLPQG